MAETSGGWDFRRKRAPSWLRRNAPMWAAGLATLVCVAVYAGHRARVVTIESLDSWELATLDARYRLRGARAPKGDKIVIVGLDDRTRKEAPELFQTRRGWAQLVNQLAGYKPEIVAIDGFFQQPELNLSPEVVDQVRAARTELEGAGADTVGVTASLAAMAAVLEEAAGDAAFAKAVKGAGNVVIAVVFGLEGEPGPIDAYEPPALVSARYGEAVRIEAPAARRPPMANWVASTMPLIAEGQLGSGFVNVLPDVDGHTRRIPLVIERSGRFYMPLALAVLTKHLNVHASYLTGDKSVGLGELRLPVDHRGRALLAFLGPGSGASIKHISAVDVATGAAATEDLAGKLVFIGYTDTARDTVTTPFDGQLHGVELHATLVHNVLYRELLRQTGPWTTILIMLILGGLITALLHSRIRRRRAWVSTAAGGVVLIGYLIAAQLLFVGGLVVDIVAPMGSVLIVMLAALSATLATEGREKAQLRSAFSQYVQNTLVDRILADPSRIKLGGVRRDLTVLFSDIRGFSRFSETLDPQELSALLNEYLTPMTELVMDAGGMLDKYIGDAIMAVYGAPLELEDHADRACDSALRMQAALAPLNRDWRERDLPEIRIGIGINTGPMSVGNMGSEARFDYTVLGDAVNLGARLESLTKEIGASILVGQQTADSASEKFVFRELGSVRVQGRQAPARVFELVGRAEDTPFSKDDLALYARAITAVRDRDWDGAEDAAREFASLHPDDRAVSHLLAELASLRLNPPGDAWDGSFTQRSK